MKAKSAKLQPNIKLIYNPHAGEKRKIVKKGSSTSLEDIKGFFEQYQLLLDLAPTKYAGHATELAKNAVKDGYKIIVAAGGDGTISEVASGLVGSKSELGILPMGSFMNTAMMLSIPNDLEKAVMLIKLGRTRKIDVGMVTKLGGEKIEEPYYFLESAGIGLEAQLHEHILEFERGSKKAILEIIKTWFDFYGHRAKIFLDDKELKTTRATLVTISNGPFTGAHLPIAPQAKLNDHKLTLRIYKMSKFELIRYFLKALKSGLTWSSKIETYQADKVRIEARTERLVHADARLFGTTPVEFKIKPNALNVITGFPRTEDKQALEKRTFLDP